MKSAIIFFTGLFSGAVVTAIYTKKHGHKEKKELINKLMLKYGDPKSPDFNQAFKDHMTVDLMNQYDADFLKKLLNPN